MKITTKYSLATITLTLGMAGLSLTKLAQAQELTNPLLETQETQSSSITEPTPGSASQPRLDLPINLTISPPTFYLAVKPGEKISHTVFLEQTGSQALMVTPSVVDFKPDGATGQPILQDGTTFPYLSLSSGKDAIGQAFRLGSLERKELVYTIDVPETAAEGEFPLTLLFNAESDVNQVAGSGSQVKGTIGSNLIVAISASDQDRGQLEIETLDTPRFVDSFGSLNFSILATNTGQNATTASGSATITNWQGNQVAEFEFLPDMILVNSSRNLRTAPDPTEVATKPETATAQFKFKPGFLIGTYTVTANLDKNSATPPGTDQSIVTAQVIAFPFSIAVVILVVIMTYGGFQMMKKSANYSDDSDKK